MKADETLKLLLKKIAELEKQLPKDKTLSLCGILKFNRDEIAKMPKAFRKEFCAQGCLARIQKSMDERYSPIYEIRYRRNGYNKSVSATTLDEAKKRFIENIS